MAIKFQKIEDCIKETGLKLLVIGASGAGKTVLLGTCKGSTVIINVEAGLMSLSKSKNKNIQVLTIRDLHDLEEALSYFKQKGCPDWICVDSISEIAEAVLASEMLKTKNNLKAYGEMATIVTGLIKEFRDLPCNVIMTSKEARVKDENVGMLYEPSLPGAKLSAGISYYFDFVLAMRIFKNEQGEISHFLQCNSDGFYTAKDRSNTLNLFEPPDISLLEEKVKRPVSSTKTKAA